MHKPEFLKALNALVLSVLLALWPGLECVAQPIRSGQSRTQAAPRSIRASDFPSEIAGMSRAGGKEYGVPELGFSVRYSSPDKASWADIFIYDKGLDLASARGAGQLNKEMASSLGGVKTLVEKGLYKNASYGKLSHQGRFATIRISIEMDGRPTASFLAMAVHKAKFVKVRLSTPEGPNSSSVQTSFLNALSRQFGI